MTSQQPQLVNVTFWAILKVVVVIISIGLLWFLRDILAILLVAVLLAALIDPFADWFSRHRLPRALAVLIVYIFLFAVSALILILLIPPILDQAQQLILNFSDTYRSLISTLGRFRALSVQYGFEQNLQESLQTLQSQLGGPIERVFTTITSFLGGLAAFLLVLVLAFYMVVEEGGTRRFFKHLAPEEYQPFLSALSIKLHRSIGQWLRGQLVLGLAIAATTYIGLLLIGIPYTLVLALLAGLLEIIPYAGPLLSAVPILIIAFSLSPLKGVLALGVIILIQQLENNFLVPKVMQKATGLNPIVSILSLLVGAKMGGVLGALLAIPVATMLMVVLEEFFAFSLKKDAPPSR
ncbi:MAG TPA: AI-2E family transporter [Patescibacteria group bacterium]|nr:AI-2E family transporter [Patescibacteria group bacterium]